MSPMMLLFFYFVGINSAVIVDKADGAPNTSVNSDNSNSWQVFKTYHPPAAQSVVKYETFAYPKYEFEYAVSDKKTGDHKHHFESRDGHRVRGEYGLVEADGSLRKVQYNADDFNGFNAVVSKTVNKHGDHAYSVFAHTRQFLPLGHGVKINHFFPSKDHYFQDSANLRKDVILSKPVQEAVVESSAVKSDESLAIEENEKSIPEHAPHQPTNVEYQTNKPSDPAIVKIEAIEGPSYQVLPASSHVPNHEKPTNLETESIAFIPITDKSVAVTPKETIHTKEEELAHKEDPHADSEVASSFYHSKVYYVGF